jgi:molecular chaperone GrpE
MSEHSGDRQTESREEDVSDADGGVSEDASTEPGDGLDRLLAALETDIDSPTAEPGDELRQRVEESDTEAVAHTLAALDETVTQLETELADERERTDDLESRLRRKQADFQNYKKRQKERLETERERATEELVERLLDVRDNLERALSTDADTDIRGGVESTLAQFDRELDRENVEPIEPAVGDTVDPGRHEVLATVPSAEPADTIADVHRPGYEMAGKLLRPAQVTVSDGDTDDSEGTETDAGNDTETEADTNTGTTTDSETDA